MRSAAELPFCNPHDQRLLHFPEVVLGELHSRSVGGLSATNVHRLDECIRGNAIHREVLPRLTGFDRVVSDPCRELPGEPLGGTDARAAFVREPSVSSTEWLSRELATRVRNNAIEPSESGEYLAVYGVAEGALAEPMYVRRRDAETDGSRREIPEYDLQEVGATLAVRVTEEEFGG